MNITLLGSGGWDGCPAPFEKGVEKRTRPQLLVETDSGSFMIEASPDIRLQSAGLSNVTEFLISHWHFDHCAGLYELDAYSLAHGPIRVYGSHETIDWVRTNIQHFPVETTVLEAYKSFSLYGVDITPVPVFHTTDDMNGTFGFLLEHGDVSVLYLADYYGLPEKSLEIASEADIVVADGSYLYEDRFPEEFQAFTSQDESHLDAEEIVEYCSSFKKVIFHSISSHHGLTTQQVNELLPENMESGFDGMNITG